MKNANYSPENRDIRRITFKPDGQCFENQVNSENITAKQETRPIEIDNFEQTTVNIGKTAIELYLLENPNSNNGKIKTVMLPWSGDVNLDITRLELAEIYEQSDEDLLVVNNPGSGNSSGLPSNIMQEIRKTGSFNPYGEIVAEAIDTSRIPLDYDTINIFGTSMGGRSAISTASAFGDLSSPIKMDYLSVTDAPGSRRLGALGIANSFMIKEVEHASKYLENSTNELAIKLQKENDSLDKWLKYIKNMGATATKQLIFDWTLAMSQDGLKEDLNSLADKENLKMIQFNSPENSELNNKDDVRLILQELAQKHPSIAFQQIILGNQTHSLTIGNPDRCGALSNIIE